MNRPIDYSINRAPTTVLPVGVIILLAAGVHTVRDPLMKSLHGDQRWKAFLRKMKLPE